MSISVSWSKMLGKKCIELVNRRIFICQHAYACMKRRTSLEKRKLHIFGNNTEIQVETLMKYEVFEKFIYFFVEPADLIMDFKVCVYYSRECLSFIRIKKLVKWKLFNNTIFCFNLLVSNTKLKFS